ncbi:MAG: type II secretion system protein [Patescibacteria group bacterium]
MENYEEKNTYQLISFSAFKLNKGFTLLELLLVMAILIILGTVAFNAYYNFQLEVKVDEEANRIKQILRQVQQKAISGEQNAKWGARFVNATSSDQYYDVFYGNSYSAGTSTDRYYLATGIDFTSPSSSSTLDVIFNKRTGINSSSSDITITIKTETSDIIKSVTTTARGLIQ